MTAAAVASREEREEPTEVWVGLAVAARGDRVGVTRATTEAREGAAIAVAGTQEEELEEGSVEVVAVVQTAEEEVDMKEAVERWEVVAVADSS